MAEEGGQGDAEGGFGVYSGGVGGQSEIYGAGSKVGMVELEVEAEA